MKRVLLLVCFALVLAWAKAQTPNTLLQSDFWQQKPSVDAVKAEIAKGNNPAELDQRSFDPTTFAINNNAPTATIKFLIDQKGNGIDKITHDSRIYLHWAALRGNAELVEYLIAKGSDLNVQDSHGSEPIVFAVSGGQKKLAVYDAFVKAGIDLKKKYKNGANLLLLGIANDKDLSIANYLVSKGLSFKDVDDEGNTAFDYAARSGNLELLKALLAKGVKPTNGALIFASQGGRGTAAPIEVYQFLVEELKLNPAYADKTGDNVLHAIVRKPNQQQIIEYFLAKGTDVNKANAEGVTPFMLAAAGQNLAAVQLLAPKVKNIKAVNERGESALTMAVNSGSPKIMSFLIDKGADVKIEDKTGKNLAYRLVESYRPARGQQGNEFTEKLNLLTEKGLNVTSPQKDGSTLYHAAIAKGDLDLLKKLAALKVDINAKDKEGLTVLHRAALTAKDDAVLKYLLTIGADKTIKTEFDETAYDLAAENGFLSQKNISVIFLKN
jgi:ankyrin repeat protein